MSFRKLSAVAALCTLLIATLSVAASAQTLPAPAGPIILTVSGAQTVKNSPAGAVFDKQMLESLGMHVTTTKTPWTDGQTVFEGPLLRDVLKAAGASGANLIVTALNDYSAALPVSDSMEYDVILAMKSNGEYMRIRDKGPLFVIYPFDDVPSLYSEVIFNRSVWQVKSIAVE